MNQKDFMVFLRALRAKENPKTHYKYAWMNAKQRGN